MSLLILRWLEIQIELEQRFTSPDPEIFTETTTFDFDKLNKRIQELAFLNRGLQNLHHR